MKSKSMLTSVLCIAQTILPPLLLSHLALGQLPWQAYPLFVMAAVAAFAPTAKSLWWLGVAAVAAIIGSIGQWALLPLALAQLGIAALIATQKMPESFKITLWLAQTFFTQLLLSLALTHLLTEITLLRYTLIAVPLLVATWADHLPPWTDVLLLVGIAVGGYWWQLVTWPAGLVIVIVATLVSARRRQAELGATALTSLAISAAIIAAQWQG